MTRRVEVRSIQGGAVAHVDGVRRRVTPARLSLTRGMRLVEVKETGFDNGSFSVEVPTGPGGGGAQVLFRLLRIDEDERH